MPPSKLGLSATSYLSVWQTIDTLEFLERAHGFGAAGIQAVLKGDPKLIRNRLDRYGMYLEAMVPLPDGDNTEEFEQSLNNAKLAGAVALRGACLGTRRYETFHTYEAWRQHVSLSRKSLEAALPLLEDFGMPLGLENHKDWTTDELLRLMREFSSEYLGICLDFGNNISLLELPMDTIEQLAPFVICTHVKDIAIAPYAEGILLSEVVLGQGILDLPTVIRRLRKSRPTCCLSLEMITRAPLQVPLLTDQYWATFPDRTAAQLARTVRFVNQQKRSLDLPSQSEDDNIRACFEAWQAMNL